MVKQPELRLEVEPAERFRVDGPLADRIREFAQRWQQYVQQPELPACRLRVVAAPPTHVGLGVGTQLGLCVATLLDRQCSGQDRPLRDLARAVGRGRRSSIGTHGFALGGLLFELGKSSDETLAPLAERVELPREWRIVLMRPQRELGLWGEAENNAFARLPAVPSRVTDQLLDLVRQSMLPAARAGQLDDFGESVYQYGIQAGLCFAKQQGGPFANRLLQDWVDAIRRRGVSGVGQSSWGPTLFALLPNEPAAEDFVAWCQSELLRSPDAAVVTISAVANHGAELGSRLEAGGWRLEEVGFRLETGG